MEDFASRLELLQSPQPLQSLQQSLAETVEFPPVRVYVQDRDGRFPAEPVVVQGIQPYFTIGDVLRALWIQEDEEEELFPLFVFLGISENAPSETTEYRTALGSWMESPTEAYLLPNPIQVIQNGTPLRTFVDEKGARQPISWQPSERMTLEDLFLKSTGTLPVFHAYRLASLRRLYRGTTPYSAMQWYGLFHPYFPFVTEAGPFTLSGALEKEVPILKKYIQLKLKEAQFVEDILQEGTIGSLALKELRHLQFKWKAYESQGMDSDFFRISVSPLIPYMRYIPATGTPMTKLFRPNPAGPPLIQDCTLLKSWVSDTVPPHVDEIVYAKTFVKEAEEPIFGTVRLFPGNQADWTLQPPEGVRGLDIPKDLDAKTLADSLQTALQTTPLDPNQADLSQVSAHLSLHRSLGKPVGKTKKSDAKGRKFDTEITKAILRERLRKMNTLFQEIEIPEEETSPVMMLRYKAVSNFENEDRIHAFLTFQSSRVLLQGQGFAAEELVRATAEEFGLTLEQARSRIATWIQKREEVVVDSQQDVQPLYNPGTDIAIQLHHPYYTFHCYRVESLQDYERIATLLSVLFTYDGEAWDMAKPSADTVKTALREETRVSEPVGALTEAPAEDYTGDADDYNYLDLDGGIEESTPGELAPGLPNPAVSQTPDADTAPVKEAPVEEAPTEEAPEGNRKIVAFNFFINKLKQLDKSLFDYKLKSAADKHYTSQCAANETRQPLVMTREEFRRMQSIYEEDLNPTDPEKKPNIIFLVYGEDTIQEQMKQAKDVPQKHRFTVLKYGSSTETQNYYLCPEYFCLKDYVVILPNEFKEAGNFRGIQKEKDRCPFCNSSEIPSADMRNPKPGQAVLKRKVKPKSDNKIPEYIRFLKDGKHPDGFELPCCFIKEPSAKEEARLLALRSKVKTKKSVFTAPPEEVYGDEGDAYEEDEEHEDEGIEQQARTKVDYGFLRQKVSRSYIQDPAKYPLQPGKIGQVAPSLDAYFGQDTATLVSRESIKQELLPKAIGFFRIGVANPSYERSQSLFSALAPILDLSTAEDVAKLFIQRIDPRTFLSLNFGNLLLEFYNPADKLRVSPTVLNQWGTTYLGPDLTENKEELLRFYRSYHRFKGFLRNPKEPKQLRHVVHALAEPGLITANGLNLIILEYKGAPYQVDVQVEVRCPALGFDLERYERNDVAFLTYDAKGIFEPLAFIHKPVIPYQTKTDQEAFYRLEYSQLKKIGTPTLQRRFEEWTQQCQSSYRALYTSQSHVDQRLLIPVSRAIQMLGTRRPSGVIRDSLNHLVALTIPANPDTTVASRDIILPISDDGSLSYKDQGITIHISWTSVMPNLATANEVEAFFLGPIMERFRSLSGVYQLASFVQSSAGVIEAYQLGAQSADAQLPRILLPCGASSGDLTIPVQSVSGPVTFEFIKDRELVLGEETDPKIVETNPYAVEHEKIEALYQQFRLSFANWIRQDTDKATLREELRSLYEDRKLTNQQKREALLVKLGPELLKWLTPDPIPFEVQPELFRKDCLSIQDPTQCSGSCAWRADESRCTLHIPQDAPIGTKIRGSTTHLFILRLFDELIRLPAMRYELMNKAVSRIQIPKQALQIGQEYILPDHVPAYEELFQEICKEGTQEGEVSRFYEEMVQTKEPAENPVYQALGHFAPLPPAIQSMITRSGPSPLRLKVVGSAEQEDKTLPLLQALQVNLAPLEGIRNTTALTDGNLRYVAIELRKPIVQILVQTTPPTITSAIYGLEVLRDAVVILVPDANEGPSIVVNQDVNEMVIPIDLVEGVIQQTVNETLLKRKFKGKKILMPKPTLILPEEEEPPAE